VEEIEESEEFRVMKEFYQIWGVGAKTAREFYLTKGWRSLDDIIEFGWSQLTRVQQIGLKFYDELNFIPIPRPEVARIGALVGEVAAEIRPGYEYIITGGYRRGKEQSGDVDMVISHRDEEQTKGGFLTLLVTRLEELGWVTHTLYLGRGGGFGTQRVGDNANRSSGLGHGEGADELEKAMVVWQEQDPEHVSVDEQGRNVSPHRRVDIILSPPSCVGTAVLGWTGGTTYERDLRRFVEKKYGWKFDSGGVWDRSSGRKIKLGGWADGEDLVQCERRVIEGLGLEYFKPELRNTG
jgi:DNA polymerase IV